MDLNQTNSKSSCTFGPRFWKAFVDDRWLVVSTNPFEKYAQTKMEINLPQIIFGVKIKTKLSCHHLDEGDCHTWYTKKIKKYIFIYPKRIENFLFRWHIWEGCLLTSPEQPRLSSDAHFSRRSSFFFLLFVFGSFKNQDMLGCPRKLGSMVSNQVGYKLYLQMGYSLGL